MSTKNPHPQTSRLAELAGVEVAPMMGVTTVAQLLGVHRATVARWTREGRLPALVVGGRLRVEADDLEAFLAHRGGER